MNRPLRIIIALGIAMLLSTFLLYTALAGKDVREPVIEAHELPTRMDEARSGVVQLVGVAAGPISGATGSKMTFFATDRRGTNRIRIAYSGSVPATFRAGRNIVVKGTVMGHGAGRLFRAQPGTLSTKCPSKFESGESA